MRILSPLIGLKEKVRYPIRDMVAQTDLSGVAQTALLLRVSREAAS
jgi:hypothetical protein